MVGSRKNEFGCTCCAIQMNVVKTFIHRVIQINILISILTFVRSDGTNFVPSSSVTELVMSDDTNLVATPSVTELVMSDDRTTTISKEEEGSSSIAKYSDLHSTSNSSRLIISTPISAASSESSTNPLSTVAASVSSIMDSSISPSSIIVSSFSSTMDSSKENNSSTQDIPVLTNSVHSIKKSSMFSNETERLSTPSFTIHQSSNYSISVNKSSTMESTLVSTAVFNSTIAPSPSTLGVLNVTTSPVSTPVSTMHPGSSKFSSSFVINSTTVCPTTTIYMNCSSDIYITQTPSTLSVVNFTSVYIKSTVASVINFTSTSYVTSILTSIPVVISTFFYSNTSILPTQLSTYITVSSTSSIVYSSAHIIIPPLKKCDVFLSDFTDAHTDLSKCILQNMHPMRICSNCSNAYNTFSKHHKNIFKVCGEILIYDYNMQYQVIPKMFAAQEMTWKSLECYKCYVNDDNGASQYSPDFKDYMNLYDELNVCFTNHTHDSWIVLPNSTVKNTTYDKQVCTDCRSLYKEMQLKYEYYGDDGEENPTKWCADINVAVNETRHKWSIDFKCGYKEKDLESVIALTCFFCFLPIVFYVGAKLHADVRERKSANRFEYESE